MNRLDIPPNPRFQVIEVSGRVVFSRPYGYAHEVADQDIPRYRATSHWTSAGCELNYFQTLYIPAWMGETEEVIERYGVRCGVPASQRCATPVKAGIPAPKHLEVTTPGSLTRQEHSALERHTHAKLLSARVRATAGFGTP